MLVPADRAGADRMRGARLPVRIGLEGISADRQRLRRRAAGRACANPTGCPSRSSRRRPRPRAATTSTSAKRRPRRIVGAELVARLKALTLEIYRRGADARRVASGIIIADTKFEFGLVGDGDPADRRRPDRRSADARLVALLAAATVRAGPGPAQLRQAVRARLPGRDPLEQAAAGAVAAGRRGPAHAREVHRRLPPPDRAAS